MVKASVAHTEKEEFVLHPRNCLHVYGHEVVECSLLQAWGQGTLPHALLFEGPRGIGKASLAYRLARFILTQPPPQEAESGLFADDALPHVMPESLHADPQHPACQRIAAGSHADLLVIEPGFDEKKKQQRSEILIEETRRISQFLSMTAGENHWRIIIIDAAEQMNRNAANSILKWLEEPPEKTLFILISHHKGALLPTIISRCRTMSFQPPDFDVFATILKEMAIEVSEKEAEQLRQLSASAPGLAASMWASGIVTYYDELKKILASTTSNTAGLSSFAEKLASARQGLPWAHTVTLLLYTLSQLVRAASSPALAEEEWIAVLAKQKALDYWLEIWDKSASLLTEADRLYLDKTQVIQAVLLAISGKGSMIKNIHMA